MTMKLVIAVALSHATKLLILDEATSGLDPIVREEILDIFLDFIHDGKIILSDEKDVLLNSYCVVKCDSHELSKIDGTYVKGIRHGKFSEEALILREGAKAIQNGCVEDATLEDIMLYMVKGEK